MPTPMRPMPTISTYSKQRFMCIYTLQMHCCLRDSTLCVLPCFIYFCLHYYEILDIKEEILSKVLPSTTVYLVI